MESNSKSLKICHNSNENELYEEMEKDNSNHLNEDLISPQKLKKSSKKSNIQKIKYLTTTITLTIILITIYLISIKNNKKNFYEFNFKQSSSLKYGKNNTIRNRKAHKDFSIHELQIFPSGNFLAYDIIMIIIYDKNFNILQEMYAFDNDLINMKKESKIIKHIKIIDENNFMIIDYDGDVLLYTKEEGKFIFKKELIKNQKIENLVFDSKGKIHSFSNDTIKIFEKNNNENYQLTNKIIIENMKKDSCTYLYAENDEILLLEDKNILIIKKALLVNFFNISNNYSLINTINERFIYSIERFDDDKLIILYELENLKVVSIYGDKVFKHIQIEALTSSVKYFKEKGIIILGISFERDRMIGGSKIKILRSDNFEEIQNIDTSEYQYVNGLFIYNIDTFGAYFYEGIHIWKSELN